MDLEKEILRENSRENWERLAHWAGKDAGRFNQLLNLMLRGNKRVSQLSSQIITTIADFYPEQFSESVRIALIQYLKEKAGPSERRNIIRIFQFMEVPESLEGEFFEMGLEYLHRADEAIAVKAFSMTALRILCEKYPELSHELIPAIEILVENKASAGLVNRGQKELEKLHKLT